jgi:hypothetical protein
MSKSTIIYIIFIILLIYKIYKNYQVSINTKEYFSNNLVITSIPNVGNLSLGAIGIDHFGYIYVVSNNTSTSSYKIIFINPITSNIIYEYNISTRIQGVAKDESGNLLIITNEKLLSLSASSKYNTISTLINETKISSSIDTADISIGPSNTYYISINRNYMFLLRSDGTLSNFGTFPGTTWGSAVDANGFIYCVGPSKDALWKLDQTGKLVDTFKLLLNIPTSVFYDNGYIYVVNQGNKSVIKFDSSGNATIVLSSELSKSLGQVAYGMIDATGSIYLGDQGNKQIVKFVSPNASTIEPNVKLYAAIPSPNIYLPLTEYWETVSIVDVNRDPVTINRLSEVNFDQEKGVLFDGSNESYIMTSDLSGNYTICFNIYVTSIIPNSFIFNQGKIYNKEWANGIGLYIQIKNANALVLGVYDPQLYNGTGVEAPVSLLNKWNFICITISELSGGWKEISLWINGIEYRKGSLNKAWSSNNFILGGQLNNGKSFTGYMLSFITFSSKLSFQEINILNSNARITSNLRNMLVYSTPQKYNIKIPPSIIANVITFDGSMPMVNVSDNLDNYTNYINMMNPIELNDNVLTINGAIINLVDLHIFNDKSKIVINFNNPLNNTLYAISNNKYISKKYNTRDSYTNSFYLSIDQINKISITIQYANIVFSNITLKLYNTLKDPSAITFTLNPFTIKPTYTTPSQFIIQDNANSWNNNLGSLNLSITLINNILSCQPGNTIQLINFTSIKPLTLSYNNIEINKFNSPGSGLFILDPRSIPTIPVSTYKLFQFKLTNIKLSSPDMKYPLLFSDILIIPRYI